jgi:hypothetical protein
VAGSNDSLARRTGFRALHSEFSLRSVQLYRRQSLSVALPQVFLMIERHGRPPVGKR